MANLDSPARLAAFRGGMLLTNEDAELQRIVREAAATADTPIALVSLVMGAVQFFRAHVGLPPDLVESQATNRCDSFCQFVVTSEKPFVVEDAKNNDIVSQVLVTNYDIQAYAGAPLVVGDQIVGSLCVIDGKPRSFDPSLIQELENLASQAAERLLLLADIPFVDDSLTPEQELAALIVGQATAVRRAFLELRPALRLAAAASEGRVTGDELVRGLSVLNEAAKMVDFVEDTLDEIGVHARRLHKASAPRS